MGIRDWFGGRRPKAVWTPERSEGDSWSPVAGGSNGQRSGRILGPLRNRDWPVGTNDQNRAGHRAYVRIRQDRQGRRRIVGFGSWRRKDRTYESHALLNSPPIKHAPRAERRPYMIVAYRAARNARLRQGK